ncbi:YfkD-like protein [Sporosarcina sp. ANT_H38]
MLKTRTGYIIFFSIILSFFVYNKSINTKSMELSYSQPNSDKSEQERIQELEQRLDSLEPPEPTTILDSPFPFEKGTEIHFPTDVIPISEVLKEGTKIPFKVIKSDPNYIRPIYEEHWHSTFWGGRWSYIPSRIHYSLHRIFPFYAIGISAELNFQQNVGIAFNTATNETDLDLYIVVFQTNITDVYTKGNQVVVVGTPKRTGVEVVNIKTADIQPSNKEKLLLVQLATNGVELDYSLINYEPPDFWLKLKQKNEREKSKTE